MYIKRVFCFLFCASLSLAILTSCGKKTEDTISTSAATSSGAAAANEEAQPTEIPLAERLNQPQIETIHDNGETFIATVSFPVFQLDALDSSVRSYARQAVSDFALESKEVEPYIDSSSEAFDSEVDMPEGLVINPFTMNGSFQTFIAHNRYVTVLITCEENLEAEAPFIEQTSFVYDTQTDTLLSIDDILKPNSDGLTKISTLSREMLASLNPDISSELIDAGTEPLAENFDCFALGDGGIRFFFPSEQAGELTDGALIVDIPYSDLSDVLAIEIPSEALTSDQIIVEASTDETLSTASDASNKDTIPEEEAVDIINE